MSPSAESRRYSSVKLPYKTASLFQTGGVLARVAHRSQYNFAYLEVAAASLAYCSEA